MQFYLNSKSIVAFVLLTLLTLSVNTNAWSQKTSSELIAESTPIPISNDQIESVDEENITCISTTTCWAYCLNNSSPVPVCSASGDAGDIKCEHGDDTQNARCCTRPSWNDWWWNCTPSSCTGMGGPGDGCGGEQCLPPQQ